jgi:hypothetical protein
MTCGRWTAALALTLTLAPAARAVDQALIDRAIERGVIALKRMQGGNGAWANAQMGATALAGLTLLECNVPANDPAIRKAVAQVRQASLTETGTYSLALAILLLDRLGAAQDVPLIESMTVRLLAGQTDEGGWTYSCPPIAAPEVQRLTTAVLREARVGEKGKEKRTVRDLPLAIQQQLALINGMARGNLGGGDNSNTQFATLALWVARRHGLPVDNALARVDARFRLSQNADGGWSYTAMRGGGGMASSAAMTCAGLLGIAVAHGVANAPDRRKGRAARDPGKDPVLRNGLLVLSTAIGIPVGRAGVIPVVGEGNGKAYYFLWSLERVAVALGLRTIGKKDWYSWGAEILLVNQRPDGTWSGAYPTSGADTCFALLFLRRANLASDLTAALGGKLRDPAEVVLRGGGVGGSGLKDGGKALPSAFAKEDKASARQTGPDREKEALRPIPTTIKNPRAERLVSALVVAAGREQERLLEQLRETRGVDYTEALALAIPRLDGDARSKARQALARRFTRLKVTSLQRYMKDVDSEIRRAAVLASAMRDLREQIPDIIERLGDADPDVVRAARAALKTVTRQDFGPEPGATREEHAKAVADWKAWWRRNRR